MCLKSVFIFHGKCSNSTCFAVNLIQNGKKSTNQQINLISQWKQHWIWNDATNIQTVNIKTCVICAYCCCFVCHTKHVSCWNEKNWTKNAHRHPGINDMNILTAKSKKVQQNIYMSISLYKSIAKYILTCNENAQNAPIPLDLWNVAFDRKVQWIPF